ncbi:hypothetical protein AAG570_011810 [Ranatra chinensis]|uniref:Uncharacterized protein n=1 Tax=Ranatra chinensis TaxID=642074 RepID=A0ABD0YIZ2_9HEMI
MAADGQRAVSPGFFYAVLIAFIVYWFALAPLAWWWWPNRRDAILFWCLSFVLWCCLLVCLALCLTAKNRPRRAGGHAKRAAMKDAALLPQSSPPPRLERTPGSASFSSPRPSLFFDDSDIPEYRKKKSFEFNFILEQNAALSSAWFLEHEREAASLHPPPANPPVHSPAISRELFFRDLLQNAGGLKPTQKQVDGKDVVERCIRTVDSLYIENEWQSHKRMECVTCGESVPL